MHNKKIIYIPGFYLTSSVCLLHNIDPPPQKKNHHAVYSLYNNYIINILQYKSYFFLYIFLLYTSNSGSNLGKSVDRIGKILDFQITGYFQITLSQL